MTFRDLKTGSLFRFPKHDDPWKGTRQEGAIWRKSTMLNYINTRRASQRARIDDQNRNVYQEMQRKPV